MSDNTADDAGTQTLTSGFGTPPLNATIGSPSDTTKVSEPLAHGMGSALIVFAAATPLFSAPDPAAQFEYDSHKTMTCRELNDENRLESVDATESAQISVPLSQADTDNQIRLQLLARSYVNKKLSNEDQARLAIASESVRRLIPRVTAEDYERLEEILIDVKRISKIIEEI